jgi:hypothetical protein
MVARLAMPASVAELVLAAASEGVADNFARWLRFIGYVDGAPIELQAIGVPSRYAPSSHFAHAITAPHAVELLEIADTWNAPGVYTIINTIFLAVATRDEPNVWHIAQKGRATTDRDIRSRAALFIDVDAADAERVRGTSASDDEVEQTADVGGRIFDKLGGLLGNDSDPLGYGHSGNGRSVFIALAHIQETPELEQTIKGFLTALALLFKTPRVEIDPVVTDAKRLGPAWGTMKRKGAPGIAARPHRRTKFVCAERVRRVTFDELKELLARLRDELTPEQVGDVDRAMGIKPTKPAGAGTIRDIREAVRDTPFERANAVPVEQVAKWLGIVDDDGGVRCPGCRAGGNSSVALVSNGLKCSHGSCGRKGPPGHPGFRTCVDLVAEVRGVAPRKAVEMLAEHFGFEGFTATQPETGPTHPEPFATSAIDLGDLAVAPPPLPWLLRDIRTGKPVLRAGQVWNVSADGGTGKGYFYLHLAAAVALRRSLFDVFSVEQDGHVALIVAEDDGPEIRHRLWRICNALYLDSDERKVLKERLHIFSLVGRQASILSADRFGELARTALYHDMLDHLGELATAADFNWALVGVDPLARFGPSKVEVDNGVATAFVAQLEEMIPRLPGKPSIGCSHHSSKLSIRNGKPDVRGVSALRDAFRASFTLWSPRVDNLRGVFLYHDKSNSAPEADPVWLVRRENEPLANGWLETSGALALANDEQAELLATAAGLAKGDRETQRAEKEKRAEAEKISKAQARRGALLECLPDEPASIDTAAVEKAMETKGLARRSEGTGAELRALRDLKLAKDLSDGSQGKPRRWCRPARKEVG